MLFFTVEKKITVACQLSSIFLGHVRIFKVPLLSELSKMAEDCKRAIFVRSLMNDSTILHGTEIAFPEAVILEMLNIYIYIYGNNDELFKRTIYRRALGKSEIWISSVKFPWVKFDLLYWTQNNNISWMVSIYTLTKTEMRIVLFKIQIWHLHIQLKFRVLLLSAALSF